MKKIFVLFIAMTMAAMVFPAYGSTGTEETAITDQQTQELTTIDGTTWSFSCPSSFTYEEGASYEGGLGQKNETKRGVLQGDYQIGICDGEIYSNVYENVEALNAQFKKSTIYEEREIDGRAAYISQNNDSSMKVIIAYTDTNYICLNIISDGGGYQAIYESEPFLDFLDSIAFQSDVEKDALTTDNGYLSVTPVGGWYEGEPEGSYQILLRNDSIGPVSTVSFGDNQVAAADQLKEYVLFGFSDYSFETKTIGDNTFEVLDAGDVAYLIADSSTGKGIEIRLWNVKLEDAMELLETVEIK